MLEDCTMEKKPNGRQLQTPGKGVATDSKKGQDGSNGKLFPKTSRRREPNGTSTAAKYEPNRKPVPQKSKAIDKRPRPRGQYSGCGKEDTKVMEDQEAEIGSVLMPGSKKQNLNHLLNFHYAPREYNMQWRSTGGQRLFGRASGIQSMYSHRNKYNKEQYLQANCQFVVKADADYSPYASNPDTLVDWDLVEQIRVQGPEVPSCPICLYPPVAAKMTRCGHVYCWPCILHYLALSDKTWRKCPICFEAVHKQDLKSVIALPRVACNIQEVVEMRLMRREKGSLVVTPVEDGPTPTSDGKHLFVEDDNPASVYSKLLLATPVHVLSILEREKAELQLQLSDETGCPEVCFTEQAIELLSERENLLLKKITVTKDHPPKENLDIPLSPSIQISEFIQPRSEGIVYASAFDNTTIPASNMSSTTDTSDECSGISEVDADKVEPKSPDCKDYMSIRCRNESLSSEGLGSEDDNAWECSITAEDLEMTSNPSRINSPLSPISEPANKYYYFYQAADGQHIYLHSINVRMLERGFGSLENCPRKLKGRVIEKEAGSMTLELRKRLRCFQHLPLACQFEVAEIELEPPLVSKETMSHFRDQLQYRRRRRQKRAREEKQWEKHAAQEEARKWGRFPSPRIHINSHHQFPECGNATMDASQHEIMFPNVNETDGPRISHNKSNDSSPLCHALDELNIEDKTTHQESRSSVVEKENSNKEEALAGSWGSQIPRNDSGTMSFAQMLREGKSKVALSANSNSSKVMGGKNGLLVAAAASAAAASKGRRSRRQGYDSEESDVEDPECRGSAPDFSKSFGDAIALALKKKEDASGSAATQGKKKKKQKQKLLFNTNMAFVGK